MVNRPFELKKAMVQDRTHLKNAEKNTYHLVKNNIISMPHLSKKVICLSLEICQTLFRHLLYQVC